MKKQILILVIVLMLCGCSRSVIGTYKSGKKRITIEENHMTVGNNPGYGIKYDIRIKGNKIYIDHANGNVEEIKCSFKGDKLIFTFDDGTVWELSK